LIGVRGLLAQVLLDLAEDWCALGFQLGDGIGVVLVHGGGDLIEIRFDIGRLVCDLIVERLVVVTLGLLDEDALELAGMQRF